MSTTNLPDPPPSPRVVKPHKVPQFGPIPGISVGDTWSTRKEMYDVGMHITLQAGIQGRQDEGACSIVLSGRYEDDEDHGETFIYTGHGGQAAKGPKKQDKDQKREHGNKALMYSHQHQLSVRVIRGANSNSIYAPQTGYRYDGIYKINTYNERLGKSGHIVYLFYFVRGPGQPQLASREESSAPQLYSSPSSDVPSAPSEDYGSEDESQIGSSSNISTCSPD